MLFECSKASANCNEITNFIFSDTPSLHLPKAYIFCADIQRRCSVLCVLSIIQCILKNFLLVSMCTTETFTPPCYTKTIHLEQSKHMISDG